MMKTSQCQNGNSRSASSGSTTVFPSAMNPLNLTSLTVALLLISAIPLCRSAPVFLNPASIEHAHLLSQIENVCTSHLSAERPLRTPDALRDLCGLMLEVQRRAQGVAARENSKRPNGAGLSAETSTVFHPLLQLMPQLHSRRRRRLDLLEDLQSPRTIQSRGYFLYRPRNGRRSTDYM